MQNFRMVDTVTPNIPNMDELETTLLALGLVTPHDWQEAIARVRNSGKPLGVSHVIEELCVLESPSKGLSTYTTVLTSYQAQEILNGNAARLRLGPYIMLNPLGGGGMGKVFRALNTKPGLRRIEALKIVHNVHSPWIRSRFRKEMQALAMLSHPNIVQVYDVGEADGNDYFTMEIVEGRTLETLVQEKGQLPLEEAALHIRRVASALGHAHKLGVLHRDVKPQNIMVSSTGETKLLDLGVAQVRLGHETDFNVTQQGERFGTPAFMPPEQWMDASTTTAASDIYTLGGTFYFALTGHRPFAKEGLDLLNAHLSAPRPKVSDARPDLPKSIDRIIAKSMAPKPEDRYSSTAAMVEDIEEILSGDKRRLERRRQMTLLTAAILGTAALVALAMLFLAPWKPSRVWLPPDFRAAAGATVVKQGSQKLYTRIAPSAYPSAVFLLIPRTTTNDPHTFYMSETEVSQGMVNRLAEKFPNGLGKLARKEAEVESLPAVGLKVADAHAVAQCIGALLPTVRQWDKAAGRFDGPSSAGTLLERMIRAPGDFALRRKGPAPVGTSPGDVGPYGCKDMAGNVAEWTRDCEFPEGYVPLASADELTQVTVRGLEFLDGPADLFEERYRKARQYNDSDKTIGFRMVIEVNE